MEPATWCDSDDSHEEDPASSSEVAECAGPVLFRPDDVAIRLDAGPDWQLASVSVRGAFHVRSGQPRQDAAAHALTPDGSHVVVAVADGVGSAARSELGSLAAVAAACDFVVRELAEQRCEELDGDVILQRAAHAVVESAAIHQVSPDELSTTLVLAVVPLRLEGEFRRVRVIGCGDSDAFVLGRANLPTLTPIAPVESSAVNGSLGAWLPGHPLLTVDSWVLLGAGDGLLLATDGFTGPLGDCTGPVADHLIPRLVPPDSGGPWRLARDLSFEVTGWYDDRTVAVLWTDPQAETDMAATQ